MRGDGKGDVGERSKPKSAHARFCSINGTIVGRWGGDNFSKVSGTRRDVLGQPEEFLELMVNLLGDLDMTGTRPQGMFKEGEAATAAGDGKGHATKLTE